MNLEHAKAAAQAKLQEANAARQRAETVARTRGHCFELEMAEIDAAQADAEANAELARYRTLAETRTTGTLSD